MHFRMKEEASRGIRLERGIHLPKEERSSSLLLDQVCLSLVPELIYTQYFLITMNGKKWISKAPLFTYETKNSRCFAHWSMLNLLSQRLRAKSIFFHVICIYKHNVCDLTNLVTHSYMKEFLRHCQIKYVEAVSFSATICISALKQMCRILVRGNSTSLTCFKVRDDGYLLRRRNKK